MIHSFQVDGMTCAHCAAAVTREVTGIDGVDDVAVDVAAGRVAVTVSKDVSEQAISDAITEAGYILAGRV